MKAYRGMPNAGKSSKKLMMVAMAPRVRLPTTCRLDSVVDSPRSICREATKPVCRRGFSARAHANTRIRAFTDLPLRVDLTAWWIRLGASIGKLLQRVVEVEIHANTHAKHACIRTYTYRLPTTCRFVDSPINPVMSSHSCTRKHTHLHSRHCTCPCIRVDLTE